MWSVELLEDDAFLKYWPHIEEMMDLVPETCEDISKASAHARAMNGSLQVWAIGDAKAIRMVIYTQIATFTSGNVLQIIWGAGQGKVWEEAAPVVEATLETYAKLANCHRIDAIGRPGWEKILGKYGFEKSAVILSRRVVHRGMH